MQKIILTAGQNPCYSHSKSTSKKGVAEFGHSNPLAAQSRNTAQSCGFFFRAPVLAARMGGRKPCRLMASASGPVDQPVRAASSFGHGVAVAQNRNWRPLMAQTFVPGASAHSQTLPETGNQGYATTPPGFTKISHIIRDCVAHRPPAKQDPIARQQAIENALSTALWHVRHSTGTVSTRLAMVRAIRAASMLKQAVSTSNISGERV